MSSIFPRQPSPLRSELDLPDLGPWPFWALATTRAAGDQLAGLLPERRIIQGRDVASRVEVRDEPLYPGGLI